MATLTKSDIAALSVDERLTLVDEIYDSFRTDPDAMTPPNWHRQMLDEILDEEERNPQPTVGWQDLRAELVQKWVR
jgi:putative addiction module component (TIGR02574 family)